MSDRMRPWQMFSLSIAFYLVAVWAGSKGDILGTVVSLLAALLYVCLAIRDSTETTNDRA